MWPALMWAPWRRRPMDEPIAPVVRPGDVVYRYGWERDYRGVMGAGTGTVWDYVDWTLGSDPRVEAVQVLAPWPEACCVTVVLHRLKKGADPLDVVRRVQDLLDPVASHGIGAGMAPVGTRVMVRMAGEEL